MTKPPTERKAPLATDELAAAHGAAISPGHEIFTPMNGIIGMLDALLDGELAPWQRDCANTARNCAEDLLQSLSHVLDYSTIQAGKLGLEAAAFDLEQEIAAAVSACGDAARDKSLTLHVQHAAPAAGPLIGAPARVNQLVSSLITHAIGVTSHGQINLALQTLGQDGVCDITLAISAAGTMPETAETALPALPIGDASCVLSLAQCRQLLELMGGRLTLPNDAGMPGTITLALRLPLAPRSPALLDAAIKPASEPGAQNKSATAAQSLHSFAGYRILVADDIAVNQQVAMRLLEKFGCQVETAADGLQAADQHAAQAYDLILMDCQMPQLDGYQATARIRATESGTRTPIIALTAHAMRGEREKCLAAGMDDFLAKPVRLRNIHDVLTRWLQPVVPALPDQDAGLFEMQQMFSSDFEELAMLFLADSRTRLALLQQATVAADMGQMTKIVHSLNGSCSSIGAEGLATLCREMELQCKAGQLEHVATRLAAIASEFARVERKLLSMV